MKALGDRPVVSPPQVITCLLWNCHEENLKLCHWKSNMRLPASVVGETDLDMSIPAAQEPELHRILYSLGFLRLLSPPWARYPGISDWLGFDQASDTSLHVHLHTRLLTGDKAVKEQDLPWMEMMNANLELDPVTGIFIPPRAFEYHLLLAREAVKAHGIKAWLQRLRGRGSLSPEAIEEFEWLLAESEQVELDRWGVRLWGEDVWRHMRAMALMPSGWLRRGHFGNSSRKAYAALAPWRTGHWFTHACRFVSLRLYRGVMVKRTHFLRGTAPGKKLLSHRAPIIAFVGSDGSGKSTVSRRIQDWLSWKADVATLYFGSNQGLYRRVRALARRIGRRQGARSCSQAEQNGQQDGDSALPSWAQAFRGIVFARARLHQQRRALRLAHAGTIVLADRWPQAELPGLCDGPSIPHQGCDGYLVRWLRGYEQRIVERMAALQPDVVIKLCVPVEVAQQRKPDHLEAMLARKVEAIRKLTFNNANCVELDAAQPLESVVCTAKRHVWRVLKDAQGETDAVH